MSWIHNNGYFFIEFVHPHPSDSITLLKNLCIQEKGGLDGDIMDTEQLVPNDLQASIWKPPIR
jgi:hypothetical protein